MDFIIFRIFITMDDQDLKIGRYGAWLVLVVYVIIVLLYLIFDEDLWSLFYPFDLEYG